jgi:hypothetical protein
MSIAMLAALVVGGVLLHMARLIDAAIAPRPTLVSLLLSRPILVWSAFRDLGA